MINDRTCTNTVQFSCKWVNTTKNDGYDQNGVECKKSPKHNCYNIPRKVNCTYFGLQCNLASVLDPSGGVQD